MNYNLLARLVVLEWIKARLDKSDPDPHLTVDNVYVVWFAYTLGNWKALLSSSLPDGMYYELTYNANKDELYFDAYKKVENKSMQGFKEGLAANILGGES
jgi:hypothetical protein